MTSVDNPSEQCVSLLAKAVWAFARQEHQEFTETVGEIARCGLAGEVELAHKSLMREPSLVNPGYTFPEFACDDFGFYALLAQDDAHAPYIVSSLVAGIPIPIADACLTKRGQAALSTTANAVFMAADQQGMAALLDNVQREPFNKEGRDMLDWLIGVGDYAAQRLEGFHNFVARIENNLAMVQATQALMAIQAARKTMAPQIPG